MESGGRRRQELDEELDDELDDAGAAEVELPEEPELDPDDEDEDEEESDDEEDELPPASDVEGLEEPEFADDSARLSVR